MRMILSVLLLFSGVLLNGAEFSKAAVPEIRARENFFAALQTADVKEKTELLLAALEIEPASELYFQELNRCEPDRETQIKCGARLLKLVRKHPELFRLALLGIHWNNSAGITPQEYVELLELILNHIPENEPAALIFFDQKLIALRSCGDFSALKDLVRVRDKKLLVPIARYAYMANFFEPEKYASAWETVQKNLKASEDNDPEHLFRLEGFYFNLHDYAATHRLRRMRIPYRNGKVPLQELSMELVLLAGQGKFAEAFKQIAPLKKEHPEAFNRFAQLLNDYKNSKTKKREPVIRVDKLLPLLENKKPGLRLSAGLQLLIYAEKKRDVELYRNVRQKLLPDAVDPEVLNAIGYVGVELNEMVDENRKLIEKALDLSPNQYAYQDSLAWAMFRQGQFKAAMDAVRKALYLVPANKDDLDQLGVIFMHAGDIAMACGDRQEAIKFYRRALSCVNDRELDHSAVKKKLEKAEASK
ncbi:MAG: hypothetical protein IJZ19_12650 [Lentisphaeria bacterium]|nr:hypothetical protein [Lentisphaeria bacterium]